MYQVPSLADHITVHCVLASLFGSQEIISDAASSGGKRGLLCCLSEKQAFSVQTLQMEVALCRLSFVPNQFQTFWGPTPSFHCCCRPWLHLE